ncbi:MAG TPA: M55 family metallopeptidase [Acidimicrobiia bacterium]
MKIFISVDMEGVSGVTRWEDVATRGQDYQRARSWMTADVNAAVAGARAAGATEIVVEENHGVEMLCNLVLDEIDPDVEVVRGLPRGGATTISALDGSFDAMLLVGHHAAAGDYPGICAHTISYGGYKVVRCNGQSISEGEIFATVAAAHGVATALIAGDDVVCARLEKFVPGIETACVKRALSRTASAIVPPARAHGIIRDAAERAVRRANEIATPEYAPPYHFEIELRSPLSEEARTAFADRFPEFTIDGDHTVRFSDTDMHVCYRRAAITSYIAGEPASVRTY